MNIEQQSQKHQIHSTTEATTTTTSEYANINVCDGNVLVQQQPMSGQSTQTNTLASSSSSSASLSNATFVTLDILSTPMAQHTITTISPSSTSTFKTPLLPMPSLEDIEGSILLAPQQNDQEQILTTTQPQQLHPRPIPGGILKYPPPPAVTNTITVGVPLGLDPGPGPPTSSLQQQQQQYQEHQQQLQPTLLCGQDAFPSPPLLVPQASHIAASPPPMPPSTLALSDNSCFGVNTGITRISATTSTAANINQCSGSGSSSNNKTLMKNNTTSNLIGGGATAIGNNLRQKPTLSATKTKTTKATKGKCCCACFGARTGNQTSKKKSNTKHRRKTQTLCSALLTNLGICAMLVAYTLLGSFIFLAIESEDSTLLQRTLASTKRVSVGVGVGVSGLSGRGTRTKSASKNNDNNNNLNNMYHTQRLGNGTHNAAAATSSLSTYPAASSSSSSSLSSSSSSAVSSYSSSAMLEGIVPLSNAGASETSIGHNDFTYATDNAVNDDDDDDEDDDVVATGNGRNGGANVHTDDVDGISPQLALSADTYDVRQRTIENIWDITVSLNILYKENWTKLAALEIAKFQDQLIKRLNEDALLQLSHDIDDGNGAAAGVAAGGHSPATEAVLLQSPHHHYHHLQNHHHHHHNSAHEWNFARAFLYSLTVLTTIGYGNIAPRTTLGRLVTLVYALFGIPLTLVYLSSTGGILAKIAREVFSKALCCCLCSNCGYCCYDERRMAEKERRMKRKRQQEELHKQQLQLQQQQHQQQQQQQQLSNMQEPYYVQRSGSMTENSFQNSDKQSQHSISATVQLPPDIDSLSASESRGSMHGLSILAPILLCLSMMIIYIVFGALVLYRLEDWPLLDGIYFCFMSLSTIGFGDMLPGLRHESTTTTWFCSIYIMSGMALTAMCFNVIHEEIVHRIRIVVEFKQPKGMLDAAVEELNIGSGGGGNGGANGGNSSYYLAS